MIDHVVRRGFEHASSLNVVKRAVEGAPELEIPKWGVALLFLTFIVSVVFISAVEYTLKDVIATLVMVETPSAAITVSTPQETASRDDKDGLLETAPTMTLIRQKPITSSIRGTIRHLVSQGGRLARFRGFRVHFVWGIAFSVVANILTSIFPLNFPGSLMIISALAGAACANLHAAWTHRVISAPSNVRFWQSIPSRSSWKLLAFPAAVYAAMPYVALHVAQGSFYLLGLHHVRVDEFSEYNNSQWTSMIIRGIAVVVIGVSCAVFLCFPAVVTLVRVEASILPEDQDTIVPFDRSFAGKVVPRILGGSGSIGFVDAWRSFDWEACGRLIKHYIKVFFILAGLVFVVAHVVAFELMAIMGPAVGKFLSDAKHNGFIQ